MKKILITGANGQLGRALDMEYKEEANHYQRLFNWLVEVEPQSKFS